MTTRPLIAAAAVLFLWTLSLHADENATWSRFHGVNGHGDAGDANLPSTWTDADYAWRQKLGARDVGSPIIFGDRVYLMVSRPEAQKIELQARALRSGELLWNKAYPLKEHRLHRRNTFASTTPTADEDNIFVAFADPEHTWLKCFDHDGHEVWSRDFGTWQSQHGFGTSPRIYGSLVLLMDSQQADQLDPGQAPGKSRVIAVDRKSGETVWETPLSATRVCYGVPAIYGEGDQAQIINANTGDGMFGLDPKTGKMLWNLKVFEMRVCSTPLIVGDIAIGSSGSGRGGNHLVAVRIPKSAGDSPEQLYRIDGIAPYVPTSAVRGDRMYMANERGIATCINVKTGEQIWSKRLGGTVGASPILVGDKLLVIDLDGKATILRASDTFEELGEVDLGGYVGATPAFSEGRLLLRVEDELRCLGGKAI